MNDFQRTPEWFQERCGCLTASQVAPLFEMGRDGKPKKAYYDLIEKIVAERISGEVQSNFTTPAMQWGIDHEDDARMEYQIRTGEVVDLTGFVLHPNIAWLGASPDGLIGKDGLLEIKCPNTATHLRRIKAGVVPPEYRPQMLLQCLCTGRKWCDYVDYDPRCRGRFEHLAYWCIRYEPTEEELTDAIDRCCSFLSLVESHMQELEKLL